MLQADQGDARQYRDLRARLARLSPGQAGSVLREMAQRVRRDDLQMVYRARIGHLGGDFSVIDILVTLYAAVLDVDPIHPLAAERDRLVLSKGHTAGALYTTLDRLEEKGMVTSRLGDPTPQRGGRQSRIAWERRP